MRAEIEEVLLLQKEWISLNSPAMQRRGVIVRSDMAQWLRSELPSISALMPPTVDDLTVEGRDGTGRKTRIPWIRLYSALRSPSATDGFYVVYLFSADGQRVYLSLMQGTTRWLNGEFHQRPQVELQERAQWARRAVGEDLANRADLTEAIALGAGGELGRGYEIGNVAALEYGVGEVPDEETLRTDLGFLAEVLGRLYLAADTAISLPGEEPPEIADLVDLVDDAVRVRQRLRSPRRVARLNTAERTAVEKRAVHVATDQLRALGYMSINDVGATQSYDLDARRHGERIYVEVKGTTSDGVEVVLTKNEVDLHLAQHPATMLIVVTTIELDRSVDPVEATGGVPHVIRPWRIDPRHLTPIAYRYTVQYPYSGTATT